MKHAAALLTTALCLAACSEDLVRPSAEISAPEAPTLTTEGGQFSISILDLGAPPDAFGSEATDINDLGQVVGYRHVDQNAAERAFLWQAGVMTELGTLGGRFSYAFSINNAGQVVGQAQTSDGATHPFLWQDGVMTDLSPPGTVSGAARAINNDGQVVGGLTLENGEGRAFLWQDGHFTFLGTPPGSREFWPEALNEIGQLVGTSRSPEGRIRAILWEAGVRTDLGTLPGHTESRAFGINNAGQVVGWSASPGPHRAFLWQNGVMTDLGVLPGMHSSTALAINELGQVVGWSQTRGGRGSAFLWQNGVMTELGTLPGGPWSVATAINNVGQVVGHSGLRSRGGHRAVLWNLQATPIPVAIPAIYGDGLPSGTVSLSRPNVFLEVHNVEAFLPKAAHAENLRLGESWATGTPARRLSLRDLNADGRSDVRITFSTVRLRRGGNLSPGTTELTLWGMDESTGNLYKGTMTVAVIP